MTGSNPQGVHAIYGNKSIAGVLLHPHVHDAARSATARCYVNMYTLHTRGKRQIKQHHFIINTQNSIIKNNECSAVAGSIGPLFM